MPPRDPLPTVWLVDDSPLEAELCRRVLSDTYAVEVFSGGARMLEHLGGGELPSAVVLDWYMPDLSGLDLCIFLRKSFDRGSLPILFLTGTGEEETVVAGLAAGANDYVTKPFSTAELRARVAALVERRALNDEARMDAALRERFIGILGHDLRQPLNTFVIGAGLLLLKDLPAKETKTIRRMAEAAERMKRMISAMLDLTQSRMGGGLSVARARINLRDCCSQVVEELRLGHPEVAIHFKSAGHTEGLFDADRIMQMVTNLIANAIEHGRASEPIDVALEGDSTQVTIAVENLGGPIPTDLQASLFDPFRRGHTAGSGGLGLGLFIVQQIALAHGGVVHVDSDDRRTRFVVTFPRDAAASAPAGT